jgi:hypothetical protein
MWGADSCHAHTLTACVEDINIDIVPYQGYLLIA